MEGTKLGKLEQGITNAMPSFWMGFEVLIDANTMHITLAQLAEDCRLTYTVDFGTHLRQRAREIRAQGGDVFLVFDPERCTRDVMSFHPKHKPGTPERAAENADFAERRRARVLAENLYAYDGADEQLFVEAFARWKAERTIAQSAG